MAGARSLRIHPFLHSLRASVQQGVKGGRLYANRDNVERLADVLPTRMLELPGWGVEISVDQSVGWLAKTIKTLKMIKLCGQLAN